MFRAMRVLALVGSAVAVLTLATVPAAAQNQGPLVTSAAQSYSLRPGDVLEIKVWGQDQFSGRFQIDENGKFQYPVLGEIDTRHLTLAQLRDSVRAGLATIFRTPFVTITPLFRMAVLGEVQHPGLYTVDPTLSVVDVVAMAGGASRYGNMKKIHLLRNGKELQFNVERGLNGRTLGEIGVRSGDEIVVPRRFFTRDDLALLLALTQVALSVAIFVRQ